MLGSSDTACDLSMLGTIHDYQGTGIRCCC